MRGMTWHYGMALRVGGLLAQTREGGGLVGVFNWRSFFLGVSFCTAEQREKRVVSANRESMYGWMGLDGMSMGVGEWVWCGVVWRQDIYTSVLMNRDTRAKEKKSGRSDSVVMLVLSFGEGLVTPVVKGWSGCERVIRRDSYDILLARVFSQPSVTQTNRQPTQPNPSRPTYLPTQPFWPIRPPTVFSLCFCLISFFLLLPPSSLLLLAPQIPSIFSLLHRFSLSTLFLPRRFSLSAPFLPRRFALSIISPPISTTPFFPLHPLSQPSAQPSRNQPNDQAK